MYPVKRGDSQYGGSIRHDGDVLVRTGINYIACTGAVYRPQGVNDGDGLAALPDAGTDQYGHGMDRQRLLDLKQAALAEYKRRRRRDEAWDVPGLFADPAWDVLLDLFVAKIDGKRISTSSACIAACVPPTTALRWLTALETEGMLTKLADPSDRRRTFVEITSTAFVTMVNYLEG